MQTFETLSLPKPASPPPPPQRSLFVDCFVKVTTPDFKSFQMQYLVVYWLMMAGDWLQGPYVYALYSSYGFSQEDIAVLFVAGFGSSMFFGTFIGSLADRLGRKRFCLLYAALYIASCLTKHVRGYWVLMLGRLLGGIATSLLFSVFDAWMVFEHNTRGHDPQWMSGTFSAAFFGNSLVAICAGVLAQAAADAQPLTPFSEGGNVMYGGYCAPFDLAIVFLSIGAAVLSVSWTENYGEVAAEDADSAEKGAASEALLSGEGKADTSKDLSLATLMDVRGLQRGIRLMKEDSTILICGLLQSLFEGSMYIFVFMWTPALTPAKPEGQAEGDPNEPPPYGTMFATFMICCMCGSSIYSVLCKHFSAEELLLRVFVVAGCALSVPFLVPTPGPSYMAFLVFEMCVGIYFPCMGTMKSAIVPEESRAALYNLFRVPLNVIVLGVLLSDMSSATAFAWSTSFLAAGAALQSHLVTKLKAANDSKNQEQAKNQGNLDDLLGQSKE